METLQFVQMNPEKFIQELTESITQIVNKPKEEEVLMTQKQVAKFLSVSKQTIINWQNAGMIPHYCIGNKSFYKKSEMLEALVLIRPKKSLSK